MEKISIVVPIYKVEAYIHECVDSLLSQTYQNLEIILVDDGSPDTCPAICDDYAKQDSRVKVIHQQNGGLSAARNSGIKAADGAYITFVDSDDYVDQRFVEELVHCIKQTDADIVCCGISVIGSGRTLITAPKETACFTDDRISLLVRQQGTGDYYMNKLYKRELLDGFELPVGKLFEDIFSMHFLFAKANKVAWLNQTLYFYRINETGISHSRVLNPRFIDFVRGNRAQYQFIAETFPAFEKLSARKYAGAVTHAATVYMQKAQPEKLRALLDVLSEHSRGLTDKTAHNDECSAQLQYEISVLSRGSKAWIKYYRRREKVKGLHNHPQLQIKLSKALGWRFVPTED